MLFSCMVIPNESTPLTLPILLLLVDFILEPDAEHCWATAFSLFIERHVVDDRTFPAIIAGHS